MSKEDVEKFKGLLERYSVVNEYIGKSSTLIELEIHISKKNKLIDAYNKDYGNLKRI